jgi:hypothetical protein
LPNFDSCRTRNPRATTSGRSPATRRGLYGRGLRRLANRRATRRADHRLLTEATAAAVGLRQIEKNRHFVCFYHVLIHVNTLLNFLKGQVNRHAECACARRKRRGFGGHSRPTSRSIVPSSRRASRIAQAASSASYRAAAPARPAAPLPGERAPRGSRRRACCGDQRGTHADAPTSHSAHGPPPLIGGDGRRSGTATNRKKIAILFVFTVYFFT